MAFSAENAATEPERQRTDAAPFINATVAAGAPERWAVHGQVTTVAQRHPRFNSPYAGTNSLISQARTEETTDITLYAGLALWNGAELWINPEIDQGSGLSNTVGAAGFPSGEAYKIGANRPYLRMPRVFIRQVITLGDTMEHVEGSANQLAGERATDNLTLTAGKFSVVDIFDTNTYAHDPRNDFMNWSIIDSGAVDYAADAWGFTYGAAAEWTQDWWTLRAGYFQLSRVPNGKVTGINFSQNSLMTEWEMRHDWRDHPGKIKLLAFVNRGRMGRYDDAVTLARQSASTPETALVRRPASRAGFALNLEQELASDLGAFARASVNQGDKEAFEFTEINKSVAAGLALQGNRWGRPTDTVGIAGVINVLSGAGRRYFAAGGIGILIGDGRQNYGPEKILETYYSLGINPHWKVSLNYQHISNPAYNRDRGPVSLYGARLRTEF